MADIRISQLPVAPSAITGDELVPVVQNGLTVQTTVSAITQSPSLTETFLTVGQQPLLPNSRYFSAGVGLGLTDGGAQGAYTIALNGTSASLEGASTGVIVKSAPNTITARTLSTTGNGISVSNGDGVSGDPTFQLTGLALAIANMSGTGLVGLNGSTLTPLTLVGDANEITIANGNGSGGNPTIGIADNAVFPGVAGVTLPNGTTAERGATQGQIRYNTTNNRFEGNYSTGWQTFGTGDGSVTSVAGTTNQIAVSTVGGAATISIDPDPVIPGTGAIQIPAGATVERPGGINGQLRYNTNTATFEGYANGAWGAIVTGTGVTSISTGTGLTGGPITSTGTISIANTGAAAGSYGSAARTVTQTVNAQGQITSIVDQAIDGIALTTGTISTAPSSANDIANKSYVDGLVSTGLVYHQPVQAATTGTLASITGGTVTYNNGTAGVGATLTLSVALTTLDGYTLLNTNRILVKDEANQAHNGVYTWATGGTVLTRATDADTYGTAPNQLSQNDYFFTQNGTVNKGTSYVVTTVGTITFGTTAITFAEFSTSQVYTAGTGLTLTGTQFSLTAPVTAALGGTGQSSYTSGDLIYASGTTSLSKLAAGTNGYLLTMNAGLPSWQPAPATGVTSFQTSLDGLTPSTSTTGAVTLAGTLGVASGGTGLTSVTANRIPYGNGTSALNTSANLTFDGTTLTNTGNAIISDNSSNAALRITQTGAGNALLVEDSANPDATPFAINSVGQVFVGANANYNSAGGRTPILQVNGTDYAFGAASVTRWSADNGSFYFGINKSRGATAGTQTIVQSGDALGALEFTGSDGTGFIPAAGIYVNVDGTPGTNDMPGRLVFATTADGASSPTERMRIDSAGNIGIGVASTAGYSVRSAKNATGAITTYGIAQQGTVLSDSTSAHIGLLSNPSTQAASFTISNLYHVLALQGTFGAGSAVTNQYGFRAEANLTGATNNYGFYGAIASGTGRWNFYAAGTAANVFAGTTSIGGTVGSESLRVAPVASAVNYFYTYGAATGNAPTVEVQGSDTNINQFYVTKGTGRYSFYTNGGGTVAEQFRIAHTASAVNYVQVTGGAAGGGTVFSSQGSDTNIPIDYRVKGASYHIFTTNSGNNAQFLIQNTASAVNYLQVTGGATGNAATLSAQGSDTNIGITLTPKGTGVATISATTALTVPAGTTAQRPTAATGMIRYNSDTGGFEGYSGSSWGSLGGGNTTTYGLWENNATISANYTITAGNNAMSAGPITVASGVVVTVPSGSTWTIV